MPAHAQVNGLSVGGGGDYPEDILGALHVAAGFDWQSKARFLLQIGDAPPHGTEFNTLGGAGDEYPHGLPSGLTGGIVLGMLKDKSIDLMLGKVGECTWLGVQFYSQVVLAGVNPHPHPSGVLGHRKTAFHRLEPELTPASKHMHPQDPVAI